MTTTRRASRMLAAAIAIALLFAAACRGSGPDVPPAAEDEDAAERIVLRADDLPGYTEEVGGAEEEGSTAVGACLNDNPLFARDYPRAAESPHFVKGDGVVRVQSGVAFAENVTDARKGLSDVRGALTGQCLKDELRKSLQKAIDPGVAVQTVTASSLPAPPGPDESVSSRVTIPVEASGQSFTFYAELTYIRQGRGIAGVATFQLGEPFPEAERNRLANLVAERLESHQGREG